MSGILGALEHYAMPALHAVAGVAEPIMHGAGGALATAGHAIPLVGAGIGAVQAVGHGIAAYNSQGNERWDHIGSAVLGGVGGALSFCPPAAAYLGAGELGWNAGVAGTGALTGRSTDGAYANQLLGTGLRHLFTGSGRDAAAPGGAHH